MTLLAFHLRMTSLQLKPCGGVIKVTRGDLIPSVRRVAALATFLESAPVRIAVA
jgi:hypothetical protein